MTVARSINLKNALRPRLLHFRRQFSNLNLDCLQDATGIQRLAGLLALGPQHDLQGIAKVLPALVQRAPGGDGSGNFLHPPDKPPIGPGLDNRVVPLLHKIILRTSAPVRQEKVFVPTGMDFWVRRHAKRFLLDQLINEWKFFA
jgi:hypothetical protein